MSVKEKKKAKIESKSKNTNQGEERNTRYSKTSCNEARKKYRGKGKE
jgi:hypothetical protein